MPESCNFSYFYGRGHTEKALCVSHRLEQSSWKTKATQCCPHLGHRFFLCWISVRAVHLIPELIMIAQASKQTPNGSECGKHALGAPMEVRAVGRARACVHLCVHEYPGWWLGHCLAF